MMEQKERVHINLARLKKNGEHFEVDVDPDLALRFKQDGSVDIREVLKAAKIFKDAQKGLLASETLMKESFGTIDSYEVAAIIIKEGEIQLTAEYRESLREAVKKRIVDIIRRYGVDPRTRLPHPPQRIESALEEGKVKIDEHKSAEDQVQDIVAALRHVLPITFSKKEVWLHIPATFASRTSGMVKSMSTILKSEWKTDGSWDATVEIAGGLESDFYDKLNNATHGQVVTKLIGEK